MGKVARKKNGGIPKFFQNIQHTMTKNKIKLPGTELELRTSGTQIQHSNHYNGIQLSRRGNHIIIYQKII